MEIEPEITIYGEHWVQAVHRVDALPLGNRGAFARMLAIVEEGWGFARPLQLAVEAGARAGTPRDGYTLPEVVYYAAEVLIVDLFRTLALEMARAVPDMGAKYGPDVMLDDVRTESELLVRYLVLTEAALRHPDVPQGTRAELLDPVFGLREWMPAFLTAFREMEAALDSLGLPEPPGYETRVQRFPR